MVLILVALLLAALAMMMALALDVGYVYVMQADLQAATDAAALAGASGLTTSPDEAYQRAVEYAAKNSVNGAPLVLQPGDVQVGTWDSATSQFTPTSPSSSEVPYAIQVTGHLTADRGSAVDLFFAKLLGKNSADVVTSSTAVFGSRDIVLVLDYSGSMNDDSELRHVARLGRSEIEQNLLNIWHDLGSPQYGNMQFEPVYINPALDTTTIMAALGLTGVPYPFPSGSWGNYISYVKTSGFVRDAGYANGYGYLTFMNYLQEIQAKASQTPTLWQTREQPITAVKDAVTVFLAYLHQVKTDDRLSLVAYTSADGTAVLEVPLTSDHALVELTSRQRQAGHYHDMTNIAAGIQKAREELQLNGREFATKMIVLLSDGKANLPGGARAAAIEQAHLAADNGFFILSISLGADADVELMAELAEITDSIYFVVPGGNDVKDYEEALMGVFATIAGHRPQRLVD